MPNNVLPLRLKQTFPPIIWICTEGEGDRIESRVPFKIFSTLCSYLVFMQPFLFLMPIFSHMLVKVSYYKQYYET